MTEIFFYKLKNISIDLFLISLIEKSISKNWNSLVLLDNTERMEEINDLLWTFSDTSFIPHGSQSDLSPDKQNVYLTCNEENLNNSNIIFSIDVPQRSGGRFMYCFRFAFCMITWIALQQFYTWKSNSTYWSKANT